MPVNARAALEALWPHMLESAAKVLRRHCCRARRTVLPLALVSAGPAIGIASTMPDVEGTISSRAPA